MARKPNDIAGVFEKNPGSGIWYIRFRANGKNIRRRIGERSEAEKALAAVHMAKMTSQPIVNLRARGESFSGIADDYLRFIENPANPDPPADVYGIKIRVRAMVEKFGDRSAAAIQPSEIRTWLTSLGLKPATLNRYRSTMSSVYRHAKEEGVVSVNPVRDLKQFRVELPHPRWLTDAEEKRIRNILSKWIRTEPSRLNQLHLESHPHELTLALGTGLRKANLYALRWDEHIDLEERVIRLPPHMTKTRKALDLPMIDKVYEALIDMQRIQEEISGLRKQEPTTKRKLDGRVFLVTENREWWARALEEAKITNLRWHDLRHTFATRLVKAGVHLSIVQKLCGHSSHNTTTRYAHVDNSLMREAINKL